MENWFWFSLCASIFQTVRNSTSKSLSTYLNPLTVTLIRFGYGLPIIFLYILILYLLGYNLGKINLITLILIIVGAVFQSVSNLILVKTFSSKNFVTAITLNRTETLFAAFIGIIFFKDILSTFSIIGVFISLIGVFCLSNVNILKLTFFSLFFKDRAYWLGILSGLGIALSSLFTRQSILTITGGDVFLNSSVALCIQILFQTLLLTLILKFTSPEEFQKMFRHYKVDFVVGSASALGSICWFNAFALAPVALVKTVGQTEVLLSGILSYKLFKEKIGLNEVVGVILVLFGVLMLAFK